MSSIRKPGLTRSNSTGSLEFFAKESAKKKREEQLRAKEEKECNERAYKALGYRIKQPVLSETDSLDEKIRKMADGDASCLAFLKVFSTFTRYSVWSKFGQYFVSPAPSKPGTPDFLAAIKKLDELGIRGPLLYRYFELKCSDGYAPTAERYSTQELFYDEIIYNSDALLPYAKKIVDGTAQKVSVNQAELDRIEEAERPGRIYYTGL